MINSVFNYVSGIVKLRGGTDNKIIGNFQNRLLVKPHNDVDTFGATVAHGRISQIQANFTNAITANDVTTAVTGSGAVTQATGSAVVASGATATSSASLKSNANIAYNTGREIYALFTAAFTTGVASSNQRIGLYDANNGFFIGYQATAFGITWRRGAVDTFVALPSFNGDALTGVAGSQYTRNGVAEAADFTKKNIFRIRYGFLGVAPIKFEILSPDGEWVIFHTIRYPNTEVGAHTYSTSLPITCEVTKTAGATDLQISTSSWEAGTVDTPAADASSSGSIAAVNSNVTINVSGRNTLSFSITGTWVGTMVVEAHTGDQNWLPVPFYNQVGQVLTSATLITANQVILLNNAAYSQVRVRASAWTSGTANINYLGNAGSVIVYNAPLQSYTYRASATFAPANTATDIFTITGSATKTIKVTKVRVTATQTTAGTVPLILLRRSTANTGGGGGTAATAVALDSNAPAASGTVLSYTVNPTTGTLVGNMDAIKYLVPTATGLYNSTAEFNFNDKTAIQPVVLRGTSQVFAVNLGGTTVTGGSFSISIEWMEE